MRLLIIVPGLAILVSGSFEQEVRKIGLPTNWWNRRVMN